MINYDKNYIEQQISELTAEFGDVTCVSGTMVATSRKAFCFLVTIQFTNDFELRTRAWFSQNHVVVDEERFFVVSWAYQAKLKELKKNFIVAMSLPENTQFDMALKTEVY